MILQNHEKPAKLLYAQLLNKRVSSRHAEHPKIIDTLRREKAGYLGELQIDYPLSKLNFKHLICHDLRLPFHRFFFQMDTLLKTPRVTINLEVKNLPGIVSFDDVQHKMIRTLNGKTEYYDDPVIQVSEQKQQLMYWYEVNGYSNIPIETLVVMVNPKTILKIDPSQQLHLEQVVTIHGLSQKIREIYDRYKLDLLSFSELVKIGQKMIRDHQPYQVDLLRDFNIEKRDLLKGVICPYCGSMPIKWVKRKWECWHCKARSSDAHIFALKDYYLLNGNQINVREFKKFMNLEKDSTAIYLLKEQAFEKYGQTWNRYHRMSFDLNKDFDYLFNLEGYK